MRGAESQVEYRQALLADLEAQVARPQDPPPPPTVWTPVDDDTRIDLNALETGLFEEQR